MLAELVQSNFPEGVALPACLRAVCDYLDAHSYPISGCFEICKHGRQAVEGWFPGAPDIQRQIAVFGNGSTGSLYALWLAPCPNAEAAPVVLLGSEGEFTALAGNALEFCRLLGLGYGEIEYDDLTTPPGDWEATAPLRAWLAARFPIQFPATGEEIAHGARDQHPGFAEWVRAWQDAHL